jgi:hypothetical protein
MDIGSARRLGSWVPAGLLVLALALEGCEECEPGPAYCEGDDLVRCENPEELGRNHLVSTNCRGSCVESPEGEARCVLSREHSAACPASGDVQVCDGDEQVSCFWGHEWTRRECGSEVPVRHCVDPAGEQAFCALAAEPSPLCADAPTVCAEDGSAVLICLLGYEVIRLPCAEELFCEASPDGSARCERRDMS